MYISEQEKKDILNQYDNQETSEKVLINLRRNYPLKITDIPGLPSQKYILIDDKMKWLNRTPKKDLINLLYWNIIDHFPNTDEGIIRRTIRKYINKLKSE